MTTKQRTFAADVVFTLGPMLSLTFDVAGVRRPGVADKVGLKQLCPTCETPKRLSQQMTCAEHGPIAGSDIHKGRYLEDGETLVRLSAEEVETFNAADMAPGKIELHVCPAEQLEYATRPGDSAYRVRLGKKANNAEHYALLVSLVSDPSVAFYGVSRLNGKCNATPFRLVLWDDQLVLQSLVRPEDLAERDAPSGGVDEKTRRMGQMLVEALKEDFKTDLLVDKRAERLAEIMAAKAAGVEIVPPTPIKQPAESAGDLLAALAAALQAA